MILPIYVYGSSVLKQKAEEIDVNNAPWLQELLDDMHKTMKNADGVGIAAPQVGKSVRALIVDGSAFDEEDWPGLSTFLRFMINPKIVWESEETAVYEEGCLSVPNIHADVTRAKRIRVKYLDKELKEVEEEFDGFACRMVQHEMDHLDGYLFTDRVSPIRKKLIAGKLGKISGGKVRTAYKCKIER